jgi:hypothetical protein
MDSVDLQIDFEIVSSLGKGIEDSFRNVFNRELRTFVEELKRISPKGVSPSSTSLSGRWEYQVHDLTAELSNSSHAGFNRLVGRGPGKMPPYGKGTPLAEWAEAKKMHAYSVAQKIAKEGTERWKKNENILGVDRISGVPNRGGRLDQFIEATAKQIAQESVGR